MGNHLVTLPESIKTLVSLQRLDLTGNQFASLPKSITHFPSLQTLELVSNQLTSIPRSIGNLKSLRKLYLSENKLTVLPESIGDLNSLQTLYLSENQLFSLPESITNLKSLKILFLKHNILTFLPKSIGYLKSLQTLDLEGNQLIRLPKSIGNLKSLQNLNLKWNQLSELPISIWQLTKLENLRLGYNRWEGEWEEIVKRDVLTIREICRQKATINIFISHAVIEFSFYKIKELATYLENQPEINHVFFCEENLKGNIDAWMEETVPKSNLLIFIGTQQSIYNSRDCSNELFLARKHNIKVTPIKGIDSNWEDLSKVGLSRELGFEFNEGQFNILCENLYKYICELKREEDLFRGE